MKTLLFLLISNFLDTSGKFNHEMEAFFRVPTDRKKKNFRVGEIVPIGGSGKPVLDTREVDHSTRRIIQEQTNT